MDRPELFATEGVRPAEIAGSDLHDLFGAFERQRPQDDRVDHGERHRRRGDGDGEHEEDERRVRRGSAQGADGVTHGVSVSLSTAGGKSIGRSA